MYQDVEFYPRNVVALKTSDTEFPSVVDAQGTGHIIIQPNHPLQRYHDTSELIFETGTRPLTASKSPYMVARCEFVVINFLLPQLYFRMNKKKRENHVDNYYNIVG